MELTVASMRPPLNAGENRRPRRHAAAWALRFNEAPAERGGKPGAHPDARAVRAGASMRPPLNAGENRQVGRADDRAEAASMRPPLNAGENRDAGRRRNVLAGGLQ